MYDPFMDTLGEPTSLQAPLQPSRPTTPSGLGTESSKIPNSEQSGSNSANNASFSSPTNAETAGESFTESTNEMANPSVTALFDPLGSLPTNSRDFDSSRPQVIAKPNASTHSSSDAPRGTRRPNLDPIATPANIPPPSGIDPLRDLLGKTSLTQGLPEQPKPHRTFSTTPLFQPHIPSHIRVAHPPQAQSSHVSRESDDFGGFVSVPATADPLASSPTRPSSSSNEPPSRHSAVFQSFTQAAKERHEENERRILGEFARSESTGGDFLGWLDDSEDSQRSSAADLNEGMEKEHDKWMEQRERKLKEEEGPYSPPATPTEGPPPQMKTPKKHISRNSSHEQMDSSSSNVGVNPRNAIPIPGSHHAESLEKPNVEQAAHETPSTSTGVSSYFPASLPRRLSSLLSSTPTPAQMSPFGRSLSLTRKPGVHDTFADISEESDVLDAQPVFTVPTRTSVAALSSVPLPNHSGSMADVTSSVPDTVSHHHGHVSHPVPDSFLTHSTPFSTIKFVPPTGAPGFKGDHEWDTGNFREEWEDETADVTANGPDTRKGVTTPSAKKPRSKVIRLIGRKPETQGVLTRSLGDSIRKFLPALARLCSTWTLLYSLDQHGISIHTFYKLSSPSSDSLNKVSGGRKGALIIIRDAYDGVFGAWVGDGLRMTGSNAGHFGGGDSFLWKTKDVIRDPSSETDEPEVPPDVEVFRWTGRNDYVALCEPDYLSLGGGEDGKTGLYLDSTLLNGSSARCATFDNEILCAEEDDSLAEFVSRTVKFEVISLEVWGLVS